MAATSLEVETLLAALGVSLAELYVIVELHHLERALAEDGPEDALEHEGGNPRA